MHGVATEDAAVDVRQAVRVAATLMAEKVTSEAVRLGVADQVEPVPCLVFAVARAGQKAIDEAFVSGR